MLPFTACLTIVVGHHRSPGCLDCGLGVRLLRPDPYRRAVRLPVEVQQPPHGHPDNVISFVVAVGTGLPEGGDRRHYETGIELAQSRVPQTEAVQIAGRKALHDEIGSPGQFPEYFLTFGPRDVQGDAALAGIECEP